LHGFPPEFASDLIRGRNDVSGVASACPPDPSSPRRRGTRQVSAIEPSRPVHIQRFELRRPWAHPLGGVSWVPAIMLKVRLRHDGSDSMGGRAARSQSPSRHSRRCVASSPASRHCHSGRRSRPLSRKRSALRFGMAVARGGEVGCATSPMSRHGCVTIRVQQSRKSAPSSKKSK